jgi:type I site-specific restriction endonuclease
MINLNLPSFDYTVKKEKDKVMIFDQIRRKYIVLTPEEWVRQHIINYFIFHLKYPKALIRVESGLTYNTLQKRSDIVVFDRTGNPWLVVECKAPNEKIDTGTVRQVAIYNVSLTAPFLAVTNGMVHFVFQTQNEKQPVGQLSAFPEYPSE